jgi:hypothetical protein
MSLVSACAVGCRGGTQHEGADGRDNQVQFLGRWTEISSPMSVLLRKKLGSLLPRAG